MANSPHSIVESATRLVQERRLRTAIPGPRSQELHHRKRSAVPDGLSVTLPVYVIAADGGVVIDVDGNSLIDLASGIAVTNVGNAAPAVVEAVTAQLEAFTHSCFMVTPYEGYLQVAERLNEKTPGDHDKRTVLFNSGAEAVENAIKIARYYTGRTAVVAFDHGYHGRTSLTMALTSKDMPYKHGFGPFPGDVHRAPMSYPYRDGNRTGEAAAHDAIQAIESEVGAANLAALIIEPIQGEGGFVVPALGFLPTLAEWARANGVVFIADEIQTGFARTGDFFACEHEGVVPDLIATAKGIAGGLPLSAVTGRAEIMNSVHAGGLGGTYGGNPLACAAAVAAMDMIERDQLWRRAREIGATIEFRLRALQAKDARLGDIRGRGAMMAVEFVRPGTDEPDSDLAGRIASYLHARGVIVLTCGTYGNVIRFLPPLTMPSALLDEALDLVAEAIASA